MPPLRSSSAATIAEAVGREDAAVVIGDPAAVKRGLIAAISVGVWLAQTWHRCGRRTRGPCRACRSCRRGRRRRSARAASRAVSDAAAAGLNGEGAGERAAERELAHRFGRIAARLGPVGIGDRVRQAHRQRRGRPDRPRRRPRRSGRRCAARGPACSALALLEDAAAARGERGGNQDGNAEMACHSGHVCPIGPGAEARRWRRRRAMPATWTARRADGIGHALVLGDRGEQLCRPRCFLPCLTSASAVISPGAAEPRLAGLGQRLQPGDRRPPAAADRTPARSAGSAPASR